MEKEAKVLSEVLHNPKRPLVVIIGGAKISTKIPMIKQFLKTADDILLGGALANTVIMAKGIGIGKSKVEETMLEELATIDLTNTKLHIPVDAIASVASHGQAPSRVAPIGNTQENEMILDIGPDTVKLYARIVSDAQTILWNGPMGLFEVEAFIHGTDALAKAVVKSKAYTVIGGGDTISFLDRAHMSGKIDHISTGGGAMLKFLSEAELPGIKSLEESSI